MARLLLFAAMIALAALVWRSWLRGGRPPAPGATPPHPGSEPIVRCERCGLNLPQSEAIFERGRWYCGRDHLPPAPGAGPR